MLQQQVLRHLDAIRGKTPIPVAISLWDGTRVPLSEAPSVDVRLNSVAAARHFLNPSLNRLGQAYVEGDIDIDGPIDRVIEVAEALSRHSETHSDSGRLRGWLARHTRKSDRRAIEYHYDVSNAFYALWLDPLMVYSCAYFRDPGQDLESAQVAKLDHICRKLRLSPGERLLDIGCGWGGLVIHAATRYGVQAVGVTLSSQQYEWACERVRAAGLADRVEIRLQDYRDIPETGGYDKVCSVGMFEHVGLKRLGEYFACMRRLLKPGGIAMNHGITASDVDNREVGLGAGEFIDRYVFPDGQLPHVSLAIRELSASGLELVDCESLRRHYAITLSHWSQRFESHLDELAGLAGDKRARIWRIYLAGCAHAFAKGWINLYQLLAIRSDDGLSPLPLTRDFMYAPDPGQNRAPSGQA